MLIKQVAINASPLIVLFKSYQSELLPQLFTEIIVPHTVWEEITKTEKDDEAARNLPGATWAKRGTGISLIPEVAAADLGKGESEVLSFCLINPEFVAIVDDRAAKKCAKALGIVTLGTGGILLLAKHRRLIPTLTPRLQALREAGLWLSDSVYHLLKQQAGE